ncbi:MAG: HD domain-containing protein [Anaeroplasma sp.]
MQTLNKLCLEMIKYFSGDPKRIQHFIKVHSFAKFIAEGEGLDKNKIILIETLAYIHDIGIKQAEAKYNSSNGMLQEKEGPDEARKILGQLNYSECDIERICYIISHHHTYSMIDDIDFQILVEADFLANFYEDRLSKDNILLCYDKYFKTETGMNICEMMFNIDK